MKYGYTIDKPNVRITTKYMYLFNYSDLNEVVHFCFRNSMKRKYSKRKQCIGVWKIKKLK